ncbi:hypothetical protein ACEPAF_5250 [Sanghuangporus sanghuang]
MSLHIANIPRFPLEIWQIIHHFATFVPSAFETNATDPFAYPGPLTQDEVHTLLRRSLFTKRNIVLVCKTWNELATRFLYEAVSVSVRSSFNVLLQGLEDATSGDATQVPEHRRVKGRWTLRLDIPLPDSHPQQVDDFVKIIQHLPNLSIVVVRQAFRAPLHHNRSFLWVLVSHSSRSLLVLDIPSYVLEFPGLEIPGNFNTLTLRALRIRPHTLNQYGGRILGPQLEYLNLQGSEALHSIIKEAPLPPSLTYLAFEVDSLQATRVTSGSLVGTGQHLTTLELDDYFAIRGYSPCFFGQEKFGTFLRKIAQSCPNLRNLILSIRCSGDLICTTYLPPIEKLGLRPYMKRCAGLHKMVTRFIKVTPSVKVVRILGKPTYADLAARNTKTFDTFRRTSTALITEHGVRYEDRTGKIFHDETK